MRCVCCSAHELQHNCGAIAKMLLCINYHQELAYYKLYSCLSIMFLANSKYNFFPVCFIFPSYHQCIYLYYTFYKSQNFLLCSKDCNLKMYYACIPGQKKGTTRKSIKTCTPYLRFEVLTK